MEANDLFPNHLHIGGPELLERLLRSSVRRSVADGSDVVRQRVQPDVNHMLRVVGHGDAPGKSRAADGKIAEARLHKGNHFVTPRLGTNEFGIFV